MNEPTRLSLRPCLVKKHAWEYTFCVKREQNIQCKEAANCPSIGDDDTIPKFYLCAKNNEMRK